AAPSVRFEVSIPSSAGSEPLTGRIYVLLSTQANPEPRFSISEESAQSQQIFGSDVEKVSAGQTVAVDESAIGYPIEKMSAIPSGDYYVQAVFNKYTIYNRADGHRVALPADEGEGQHWARKPGNLYSKPVKMHLQPGMGAQIKIELTDTIPAVQAPADTDFVKHIRIQSQLLTKFWGRPMYLGAIVIIPEGWAAHPDAHYPLLVNHGHFQADYRFRTTPPDAGAQGAQLARTQTAYQFYQDWSQGKLPRMLILIIQHANPFYDDSYAVNSANVGPYGDAINSELIPAVEKQFHGIGQGWARGLFGGSTGGWETLASQIFYPDNYNGAWGACPDPVDFHAYQTVNIYDNQNAFYEIGPFGRIDRPDMRRTDGTIEATTAGAVRYELALGTHDRSTEQWNIWESVFSPVGADGYPKPIWDPLTGAIDHDVANHWKDHYDLNAILQRDWKTLAPKLDGKIHVMVGTADTYFLDNAVRLMQKTFDNSKDPHVTADFDYGEGQPHCYTGGGVPSNVGSGTFTQRVLKAAEQRMLATAPTGADTKSWRY
ncbi:MAG TPA: hypothetical protein VFO34_02235, partial [Candidatus Acidoferrales bacterium]|nr:hypothetical protein [Candidatus Acidoferrales bacterium]